MSKPSQFSPEVRERAVRLVREQRGEHPSLWAAVEADAPAIHDRTGGPITRLVSWVRKQVMKRAGAGVPSPNKIILLRAASGGAAAQTRIVLIDRLNSPFGMALVGNDLYVADTDALLRFTYVPGETVITSPGVKVAAYPRDRSTITGRKISLPVRTAPTYL